MVLERSSIWRDSCCLIVVITVYLVWQLRGLSRFLKLGAINEEMRVALEISGRIRRSKRFLGSLPVSIFASCIWSNWHLFSLCRSKWSEESEIVIGKISASNFTTVRANFPSRHLPYLDNVRIQAAPGVLPLRTESRGLALVARWYLFGVGFAKKNATYTSPACGCSKPITGLRFDLEFLALLPTDVLYNPTKILYVPSIQNHGGCNDKFALGPPEATHGYLRFISGILATAHILTKVSNLCACFFMFLGTVHTLLFRLNVVSFGFLLKYIVSKYNSDLTFFFK